MPSNSEHDDAIKQFLRLVVLPDVQESLKDLPQQSVIGRIEKIKSGHGHIRRELVMQQGVSAKINRLLEWFYTQILMKMRNGMEFDAAANAVIDSFPSPPTE